ncbi:MAG: glycogen-binding domain-containing protein [Verrucomicrobiota bacterium]
MQRKKKATVAPVVFSYTDPHATVVHVAGSFNEWSPDAHALTPTTPGDWQIKLPLPPGRYEYLFVVDGRWTPDPLARETAPNPHGGVNSVVQV